MLAPPTKRSRSQPIRVVDRPAVAVDVQGNPIVVTPAALAAVLDNAQDQPGQLVKTPDDQMVVIGLHRRTSRAPCAVRHGKTHSRCGSMPRRSFRG